MVTIDQISYLVNGNIMEPSLSELMTFLQKAMQAAYAGNGKTCTSQRKGHREFEYHDRNWYYRDSYAGFYQSWGQEIVWYNHRPFWAQLYGGGMEESYQNQYDIACQTFTFLKTALCQKEQPFQPRGPFLYHHEAFPLWEYSCKWDGSVQKFDGFEKIRYDNSIVFTHQFIGGFYYDNLGD